MSQVSGAVLTLLVVIISYLVLEAFLRHVSECCCHVPRMGLCLKSDRQAFYIIAPRETCVAVCIFSIVYQTRLLL